MVCPKCRKSYYFILKSNEKKCFCRYCKHTGIFIAPTYKGYHDTKYSYSRLRTKENDPLFGQIFDLLDFKPTDKVLDYGCGAGDLVYNVAQSVAEAIGVDINIEKSVVRFPHNTFKKQAGHELPNYKSGYFDKIVSINVIEHIHDFEGMLIELKRALKPNGKLFITTYDTKFILRGILYDPTHIIEWDKLEFETLVSKYFKIETSFRSGSFFNYVPLNKLIVKFLKPELCIVAYKP